MENAIRKAGVLIEALPYIRSFRDKVTVIKLGGSVMEDAGALRDLLQDVVFMETVGMRPVLVHGGGKAIDRAMAAAGITPKKVQGRRVTDEETLRIVMRVLQEEINADIVRQIEELGGQAVPLHTGPLQALFGRPIMLTDDEGQPLDLGRVGQVTWVNRPLIENYTRAGVVPVLPCIALDEQGRGLNINADTAAAAVAIYLQAEKLVLLTDTPGILNERGDPESLIHSLDAPRCRELVGAGVIDSGMLPKVEACLDSLRAGVKKTHVIDGRLRHSLLLEIYTPEGVGTEIVQERTTVPS
ncbi:MAG TPA: acetylglutamate kinase [Gemmatales bacterium]|nr:acetylglutamate kinase [Gemmatales bacterium]